MKLQLTHLRLLVTNYKESFLFYRDLLEFAVDWGDENTGYAEFNTGSLQLAVLNKELMTEVIPLTDESSSVNTQDKIFLIFAVDNVDEVHQRLIDNNVTIVTPPQDRLDWGIRTAHFRDPDGNLLEVYSNLDT
jgi:lactoylglutathione lyase